MRRIITTLALSAALISTGAHAQEMDDSTSSYESESTRVESDQPGLHDQAGTVSDSDSNYDSSDIRQEPGTMGDESVGTTTATESDVSDSYLRSEVVGIRPQAGALFFENALTGNTDSRFLGGLTLDVNVLRGSPVYLGPSTGFLFSHVGPVDANFFGTDSPTAGDSGGNIFIVPANLKLGYNIGDRFRVAAHGGANLVYRSIANALNIGGTLLGSESDTTFYPNAGLDLEWGLGQNIALTLRPDWTFTTGPDMATATLALAIPIG
jgi:hypothetical protein